MKIVKYKEQALEDFSKPQRIYSDLELQDFHTKIQKFWVGEPRQVEGGLAQKFDHEALAVAFGAAVKVKHGTTHVYLYNERNGVLVNLWKQYEEWRKKLDWVEGKREEEFKKTVEEVVPF